MARFCFHIKISGIQVIFDKKNNKKIDKDVIEKQQIFLKNYNMFQENGDNLIYLY